MDTAQWPQEIIVVKPLEEIVTAPQNSRSGGGGGSLDRRLARTEKEQALNCPRCNSTNTKFCYYNNYSLTQPRYFCKTCRRYWTQGGSLRNIPVGGGSKKNKRPSSSSSLSPSKKQLPGLISSPSTASLTPTTTTTGSQNPNVSSSSKVIREGQDLNLTFPRSFTELIHPNGNHHHPTSFMHMPPPPPQSSLVHHHHQDAAGLSFPVLQHDQDFKPGGLSFSLDDGIGLGIGGDHNDDSGSGYHHHHHHEGGGGGGRGMFSLEDLKQVAISSNATTTNDSNGEMVSSSSNGKDEHAADSSGCWTGMLGGGSW